LAKLSGVARRLAKRWRRAESTRDSSELCFGVISAMQSMYFIYKCLLQVKAEKDGSLARLNATYFGA
jgi:hypothetical protein